jgi:hypothetical protein
MAGIGGRVKMFWATFLFRDLQILQSVEGRPSLTCRRESVRKLVLQSRRANLVCESLVDSLGRFVKKGPRVVQRMTVLVSERQIVGQRESDISDPARADLPRGYF